MKAKTAIRRLGGEWAVRGLAMTLSSTYGVKVDIVPCVDATDPADNWLNILIETPNELFDEDGHSKKRDHATDTVECVLMGAGLSMDYECGGDGETGPIDSYRVN